MTKDDIINKLQAQGLRWIESKRDAQSEPVLDAAQDAITTGTGILRGGERIDPASIYKSAASVQDWDEVYALRGALREHMAEIHRLRAEIEKRKG